MKKFLRLWLEREFGRFKPLVRSWFAEFLEEESRALAAEARAIGGATPPAPAPSGAPFLHTESASDPDE